MPHPQRACMVFGLAGLLLFGVCQLVPAYIDQPAEALTVPKLILEFRSIAILQIDRLDLDKGAIRFKHIEQIQGPVLFKDTKHAIRYGDSVPAEFKGLKEGQTALFFAADGYGRGVTLFDSGWYCSNNYDKRFEWWHIAYTAGHYDFNCAYTGPVSGLAEAVKKLLRGEDVVVKCRKKSRVLETQFVRCSLREPGRKEVVPDPKDGPTVKVGGKPKATAAGLAPGLQDGKVAARVEAAEALAGLGAEARSAVGALVAALRGDKDPFVRRAAAVALGAIGPDAREAVPVLIERLQGHYENIDGLIGAECAAALAKIDPAGQVAVALLAGKLKDPSAEVRLRAAGQLALIGRPVRSAAADLIEALKDNSPDVRYAVVSALASIQADPQLVVPAFRAALQDESKYVRFMAARALGNLGPDAKGAVAALQKAAKDKDAEVRQHATEALKLILGK